LPIVLVLVVVVVVVLDPSSTNKSRTRTIGGRANARLLRALEMARFALQTQCTGFRLIRADNNLQKGTFAGTICTK
jgi:hypothetical protein